MGSIQLKGRGVCVTAVPNRFIDEYMTEANGEFVKVYLYLLRCLGQEEQDFSVSSIADRFDHTEKDVLRALKYWERTGLLKLTFEGQELTEISLSDYCTIQAEGQEKKEEQKQEEQKQKEELPKAKAVASSAVDQVVSPARAVPEMPDYSLNQVSQMQEDPAMQQLLFVVQAYLGLKMLSDSEMRIVMFWADQLHFSAELVDYMVQYCVSRGKKNFSYMNKVAISWYEKGFTSPEEAQKEAVIHSKAYYTVKNGLGIKDRSLIPDECKLISKWDKEYGFSIEMIQEACRRTIMGGKGPSFKYVDGILTKWKKENVMTLQQAQEQDLEHAKRVEKAEKSKPVASKNNSFKKFQQREYDKDSLEQLFLQKSVQ